MSAAQDLRHEEVWDDTELVDSWNAAVEEYKYYHSLHARGEKVEDVLRQVDEANAQHEATDADALRVFDTAGVASHAERDIEDGEIGYGDQPMVGAEVNDTSAKSASFQKVNTSATNDDAQAQPAVPGAASSVGVSVPQTLLAGQDEALKGLMMSWYYAGYYTGLYEGQQKAQANNGTGGG